METAAFTQFTADHDFAGATHYEPTPFGLRPVRIVQTHDGITLPSGQTGSISRIVDDFGQEMTVKTSTLIAR